MKYKFSFKRVLWWIIINGAALFCAYQALCLNHAGAQNLLKFLIWFIFVTSMIAALVKTAKEKCREKGPSIPVNANMIYGFLFACALAYFGWFGYAALDMMSTVFQAAIYSDEDDDQG